MEGVPCLCALQNECFGAPEATSVQQFIQDTKYKIVLAKLNIDLHKRYFFQRFRITEFD